MSGIINSDPKAFDQLFNSYYNRLCNYASLVIHDSETAEDIVQDLFAGIWVNRKQLLIKSSFNAYLFRSVYNSCLDHLKHQKIKDRHQCLDFSRPVDSFNDSLVFVELLTRIESCIDQLPEQCKKIFRLSRFENLKYKEIAELLNISENSVDTQMRRALNKLKDNLKEYLITIFLIVSMFF